MVKRRACSAWRGVSIQRIGAFAFFTGTVWETLPVVNYRRVVVKMCLGDWTLSYNTQYDYLLLSIQWISFTKELRTPL